MYKVFFKDRIILLGDETELSYSGKNEKSFKYENRNELNEILELFYSSDLIKILRIYHDNHEKLWEEFKSCFRFINAAGGLVYNKSGKILIIKRNGIWDLPKGKAEKDEGPGDTALREISEECGINSLKLRHLIIKTYHSYFIGEVRTLKQTEWFDIYTEKNEKIVPQIREGITEIKWFDRSNISEILDNTFPSIIDVLQKAGILQHKDIF